MNLALGQTQTDLSGAASSPEASVYQIKWISFQGINWVCGYVYPWGEIHAFI